MTLDERAARAAEGVRRAVLAAEKRGRAAGPPSRRPRRRPRLSIVAVAGVTAVIVAAAFALGQVVSSRQQRQAAEPSTPRGLILYGQWHPTLQESSWFTVRPNGAGVTNLHVTTTCASWWPGARKILISDDAYARAGHPLRPATVNPDGTGLHRLDAARAPQLNLGCGQVAPDGKVIALEGFGGTSTPAVNGIYLVRASDGGGLVRLTHSPSGSVDGSPRFSPDGHHVVFLRGAPGTGVEGAGALYVTTTTAGAVARRITPGGFAFLGYDWSPDGRWIVFQHPYGQLYVVHPDGTGLHRIQVPLPAGAGAQDPVWASASNAIAFSLVRNERANIFTVQLDGARLRQVTHGSSLAEQTPDWSH